VPGARLGRVAIATVAWIIGVVTAVVGGVAGNLLTDVFKGATKDSTGLFVEGVEFPFDLKTNAYYFRTDIDPVQLTAGLPPQSGQADPREWADRVDEFFTSHGGDPSLKMVKVSVVNHFDKPVVLTGAWSVVERREHPTYVAAIQPPATGGGGLSTMDFDLSKDRSPGVVSCGAGTDCDLPAGKTDQQETVSFFAVRNLRIKPEDDYAFLAFPLDAGALVSWHIVLSYTVEGESERQVIVRTRRNTPFRGTSYTETQRKYRVSFDSHGDLVIST
jgi:hypothetical protein